MKKFIGYIFLISTNLLYAYEIPTISVLNLFYKKAKSSPIVYKSFNDESGVIKTTIRDNKIENLIIKNINMFNNNIKGKISQTKNFKIIDNININNLWCGDTEVILKYILSIKSSESIDQKKYIDIPNYILLGEITSFTNNTDIEVIQDTDKQSIQFNLDINVSYNLISTKDVAILASFDVVGHGNETKIFNENSTNQKINPNLSNLIKQLSDDLSDNVVNQINKHFTRTNKTYKLESVENFMIYN